jgi:hypothetical protein
MCANPDRPQYPLLLAASDRCDPGRNIFAGSRRFKVSIETFHFFASSNLVKNLSSMVPLLHNIILSSYLCSPISTVVASSRRCRIRTATIPLALQLRAAFSCFNNIRGSSEQLVCKNDRTSRQIRSWFSGVFACHKLQEFATGCVIRHMMSQLSFIVGTPKREQRATFVVDVVQDQLSWR